MTANEVKQINDELSHLSDRHQSSGYVRLMENGKVQLDQSFSKEHLIEALEIIGWVDK